MKLDRLLYSLLLVAPLGTLASCGEKPAPPSESELAVDPMAGLPNGIALDELVIGAGQPSDEVLLGLKERGFAMVVNLRQPDESGSESAELVEGAGLLYASLPIGGGDFTADDAHALRGLLDDLPADSGKVLIHCGSGSRVGALWATMRALEEGMTPEQAVELAQASGKVRDSSLERVRELVTAEN